jgi:type I restriction enzyme S subunit
VKRYVLPSSWRRTTLGEVAAPVPNAVVDGPFGSNLKLSDYVEEGVPVLQGKNITNDSFRWFDVRFISHRKACELKRSSVRVGDILLVKIGSIGYAAVVDSLNGFDFAIIPANLAKVTADSTKIDIGYLHKWLTSVDAKRYFLNAASKTAQPALSLEKIKNLPIPLPPLPEQRRIAEILDKADALRTKRRAALAQLDTLTQSIFLDMFGEPRTHPEKWPIVPLEEMVKETRLGLVRGSSEFGQDFSYPYVRMNAITRSGELDLLSVLRTDATEQEVATYRLEARDFLFNTRNSEELVGKTALYSGHGVHLFNNNLMRMRFNGDAEPEYVAAAFRTKFCQHELNLRKSGTTNVFAIYWKDLRSLPIPLPPLQLQRSFIVRTTAIERLKTAYRASLSELDRLFTSLQYRAFRGDL